MLDRVAIIEELQSGQVAKFYTGIKCIAYSYQSLIFYMNLILMMSYGVFNGDSKNGISKYKGKEMNIGLFMPLAAGMMFELFVLYPFLVS